MGSPVLHTDIAIIGGGIAGLWALNQLRNRGYGAILFEQEALGSHQTIGSQGMIHGGIKYALAGAETPASETIAAMPAAWRECLAGRGAVDLRACRVLSQDFHLWSLGSLTSRLGSLLASRALRGAVEKLARADYPAPLDAAAFKGDVYRLDDLVLDVPSLVGALAGPHRHAIFRIDWNESALVVEDGLSRIELPDCILRPERLLLTAGAGNEDLLSRLGVDTPAMQRRPLQQVLLAHDHLPEFFGHCLDRSTTPRLTISSHRTAAGDPLWYLGGELAETGADREPEQLLDHARDELSDLLPWIDLEGARWRSVKLERAEPRQAGLLRPEGVFVDSASGLDNVLIAWPTKLTLSPALGDAVERRLRQDRVKPCHRPPLDGLQALGKPDIAVSYWEHLFR